MRKKENKFKFMHLIVIIILLVLIVGCVIIIRKNKSSITSTIKGVEKQKVEVIDISYMPEADNNVILEDEKKIEEHLRNNQLQIFGKEFSKDIDFKFSYTINSLDNVIYVFNQTYKDIEISDIELRVFVTANEKKLISINGNYVEPIDFNIEVLVNEEEAYKKVVEEIKIKDETEKIKEEKVEELVTIDEDVPEPETTKESELGEEIKNSDDEVLNENNDNQNVEESKNKKKIYIIENEYIVHGYEFHYNDSTIIVDANSGEIVTKKDEEF